MKTLIARVLLVLGLGFASAAHAQPTLSMQPWVCPGCAHDATWSGIASPSPTDWIGFYAPGAADSAYLARQDTTGAASGTVPFTLPTMGYTNWGTFELRLFSNGTFKRLATTTVSVNPVIFGYARLNGTELAGATVHVDGTPCNTTPASGMWGCIVPSYNWSGTVTISKPGYIFTPASRTASNINTYITGFDFTAAVAHEISGTITLGGSPLVGVAMNASGGTCTSTNASGQYTCAVPAGWSGSVAPVLAGHSFSPSSRNYPSVGTSQSAQNFTATAVSNPATLSMQAWVCPGCVHDATWSGIASPSPTDWIGFYAPGAADSAYLARRDTTGTAGGTVPFTLPTMGYTSWGTFELRLFSNGTFTRLATTTVSVNPVVFGYARLNGTELAGATVHVDGTPCNTTPASGMWGCIVPSYNWSGTITLSMPGYIFTPASHTASNINTYITGFDFTASAASTVSGTVTLAGSPLAGVAIAGSNGALCNAVTDATGQYTCSVLSGWSGTMTPTLAGHSFDPPSRSYTNVTTAQAAQDYASTQARKVSGSVMLNGLAIPNVTLAFTNGPTCAPTNLSGQFTCYVPDGWSGSLTPSASGYAFTPASRSFTTVSNDQAGQTFSATLDGAAEAVYFVQVDHLNTPRLVANAAGETVWRWDQQEPFGSNPTDNNPSGLGVFDLPLRLPGQTYDVETGLHYNYFRDYDPTIGRYGESDPIGLSGGLNTYIYGDGTPITRADPFGLQASSCSPQNPCKPACKQSYFDCLANCIRANDPTVTLFGDSSTAVKGGATALGGTFPKSWVGLPKGLGGASPVTTVPSAATHALGGGTSGTVGGAARSVGRFCSPIWIGYGLGMAAVEVMCAAGCAQDSCLY
jgi:RHS repeat-associated protein